MIEVRESHSQDEWDEYIVDNQGHPLQLWGWGEVKKKHGWIPDRFFVYDDNERIGAIQILTKTLPLPLRAFSYAPRNAVFHVKQQQSLDAVARAVKAKYKGITLSIEPDTQAFEQPTGWVRATNKILPSETILIDITASEDDIQSHMAKKTRQYIRKSQKNVQIRQIQDESTLQKCLDIYKMTAKRAGFALHDDEYYLDVSREMADHAPLFGSFIDGELVAFLWLAISGSTAYELYGGMNDQGQASRANYALKWHAVTKMKEWGLTKYDFGGVVAGGVATFKQGWSTDSTFFAGTYDKPLSPLYILWSHGLPFAKKAAQRLRKVARRG